MCTLLSSHMPAAHHPESFRSGLFRVIHTLGHLIDHDGGKALAARPTAENVFNGVGGEGGGAYLTISEQSSSTTQIDR